MRFYARTSLLLALTGAVAACAAPAAQAAFGVQEQNFEAGTCVNTTCTYKSVEKTSAEAYTQSAGHPPLGADHLRTEPVGR